MTYYTVHRIISESLPLLTVLVALGIGAGQLLATSRDALFTIPVLLAIVPPINAASGMVGAVFGSRVATGLHTGSLLSHRARQFRRDVAAAFLLGAAVFAMLALLALVAAQVFERDPARLFGDLLLVVLGTGALVVVGMVLTVIIIGSISFRVGLDPDNIVVPVVTTAGDLLGISSFILMVHLVGL